MTPLKAAPASPVTGAAVLADGVTWNPLSQNGGLMYWVAHDGTAWRAANRPATADLTTLVNDQAATAALINWTTPEAYKCVGDYWLADGTVNPSPTDNTLALQAMLDAGLNIRFGTMGYRTGYYTGSLKLRPGHVIEAPYSAGSTDITQTVGTYLVGKPGINEILDTVTNNAGYLKIDGLGLYGRDYSCEGVNRTQIRSTFTNMHVIRCRSGFNRVNVAGQADTYGRSGCHFINVTACDNLIGACNTVDSKFVFGRFASNKLDGIQLNDGANDNFILGTKLDFNDRWGVKGYNANRQTIITENVDRNGMGGISLVGCVNCRVDVFAQRNGRWSNATATAGTTSGSATLNATAVGANTQLATGQVITGAGIPAGTTILAVGDGSRDSGGVGTYTMSANATATAAGVAITTARPVDKACHVYLGAVTGLLMTLRTNAGADDDGLGNVGAKSSIVYAGNNVVTILGDAQGCTGAPSTAMSGATWDAKSTIMCAGLTSYASGISPMSNQSAQLAADAAETVVIAGLPPVDDNGIRSYSVTVTVKRSDSGSVGYRAHFAVVLVRSTGVPTVIVGAITSEVGTAGGVAFTGTPSLMLLGAPVSDALGTQLSFPVTGKFATASTRLRVRVRADD